MVSLTSPAKATRNLPHLGNGKGEVILFEPSSSEHVSARTIFDPITAIAPSADCKHYAIGYNNGSLLLAALQPSFTILHTLTTSRAPSPISSLMWHASSSKQKSDMLAAQTADGDLRVWSVSKPPTSEAPKVIRVLKRPEPAFLSGRTWMSWSKNGRIIQHAETEVLAWDVRTKHVTCDQVPVVDGIKAMTAYGPTATMFSVGPDYTVQQYDLEQLQLVKNVRHMPTTIPPTPPEDHRQFGWNTTSGSEEDVPSSIGRAQREVRAIESARAERNHMKSPESQATGTSKVSRPSARGKEIMSPARRTELTGTTFSAGIQSGFPQDAKSPSSARTNRKASRLRQEVIMSPAERPIEDLFPYIRARLSDVPYRPPRSVDELRMTPDDLRRQMLSVVFGWEEDIDDLIRDELSRHPPDSSRAIFLTKWLNEDPDYLAEVMRSTGMVSGMDWLLLAMGVIDENVSSRKIVQVFLEKLLSKGDIHAAVTLLLAIGDKTDAIEVYVSRDQFLEAVLLACLVTPSDWQRQSHLVRKWGEHVVENSQQQLAIRCFSCTGVEPSEPWTSPTAQMATRSQEREMLKPLMIEAAQKTAPLQSQPFPDIFRKTLERRRTLDAPTPVAMPAPPTPFRTAAQQNTRITPQSSALKLITSFDTEKKERFKFPGLKSDDHTPTHGATVTPIAESAIDRSALSPGGTGSYRTNNMRSLNSAMSARTPGGYHRQRLASIGETPIEGEAPEFPPSINRRGLPTPADSNSDKEREEKEKARREARSQPQDPSQASLLVLSSARYDPGADTPIRETPQTALGPQTAIKYPVQHRTQQSYEPAGMVGDDSRPSTGSRSRKPDGLSIQMIPVQEGEDLTASTRGPKTRESYQTTYIDTNSEMTSNPRTGDTFRSVKSPSVSGRSLEPYLSSLDQAQYYNAHGRPRTHSSSKPTSNEKRTRHRQGSTSEDPSTHDDRRTIPSAKRSPSSPVPMSPDDLRMYSQSVESIESMYTSTNPSGAERTGTPASLPKLSRRHSHTTKDDKRRHRSRSGHLDSRTKKTSRDVSRNASPNPSHHSHRSRGRSRSKGRAEGEGRLSPSSPVPMIPSEEDRQSSDPALRIVSADRRRTRGSSSRGPSRDRSQPREDSTDRRRRHRSRSRQADEGEGHLSRKSSISGRGESSKHKRHRDTSRARSEKQEVERQYQALKSSSTAALPLYGEQSSHVRPLTLLERKKKELAAAELEARRLSLARRPSAPHIPFPGQGSQHAKSASEGQTPPLTRASTDDALPSRAYGEPRSRRPSTPRAMQVTPGTKLEVIDASDADQTLPSSVYGTPNTSMTSPRPSSRQALPEIDPALLAQLPRHHAYDATISSRSSSKNRETSRSRGQSREPLRISPREIPDMTVGSSDPFYATTSEGRPILPELQHLVSPPPPPPPPAPPKDRPSHLRIDSDVASRVPLPLSAIPRNDSPAITNGNGHRRGRSGSESTSQLMSKIRSFGRMRSTSRGRDNMSKSPHIGSDASPMPYETNVNQVAPIYGVETR